MDWYRQDANIIKFCEHPHKPTQFGKMFGRSMPTKKRKYRRNLACIRNQQSLEVFTDGIQKYFKVMEEGSIEDYVGCEIWEVNENELLMRQSNLIKKI